MLWLKIIAVSAMLLVPVVTLLLIRRLLDKRRAKRGRDQYLGVIRDRKEREREQRKNRRW